MITPGSTTLGSSSPCINCGFVGAMKMAQLWIKYCGNCAMRASGAFGPPPLAKLEPCPYCNGTGIRRREEEAKP